MGLKEQIEKLNPYGHYKKEDVFQPGAFNPGLFEVDMAKLKKLRPEMFLVKKEELISSKKNQTGLNN